MSNPFEVKTRPLPKPPNRSPSRTGHSGRRSTWFGLLATVATVLLLVWFARQDHWNPEHFKGMLLPMHESRIFVAKGDLDQAQARTLYRQALENLASGNHETALEQFKRLEGVYPGLQDIIWLHQAEVYAAQGNEWAVQKKLNGLLSQHRQSAFAPAALYRIGQSQFRGSEWDKARQTFEQVRRDHPKTEYAKGSLYHLGMLLARESGRENEAADLLSAYLADCPDCRFSGEAAEQLRKLRPQPSIREHALIGMAFAASGKDVDTTLAHLQQAPVEQVWLALGKTHIRAGRKADGVQVLMQGLTATQEMDTAREAVDLILAHAPSRSAALAQLRSKTLPVGGDYVLWKSAELEPASARAYYQRVAQQYPQGDYAPESSWRLIWPLLLNGQQDAYLSQTRQYLARYPFARSAPTAQFWVGKILERREPAEAVRTYRQLVKQYPTSYYAFRATGRLKALAENQRDPGWHTQPGRSYPPPLDFGSLDILPPAEAFGGNTLGEGRRRAAQELQAIGATEDLKLLVSDTVGDLSPAIKSWAEQVNGNRAQGLRTIRDALEKRNRDAFIASGRKGFTPAGSRDELKLLYPVYFGENIARFSRQNRLDPFLVQSLMREESYFNEFAISTSNALGLMQLLPSTAGEVAGWEKLSGFKSQDLFLPEINVRLGSRYLAYLHETFNHDSMPAVGAYNGGPGAMKRWVGSIPHFNTDPDMFVERIPYEQSRDYIKKVFASYWNYTRLYGH